MLANLDWHRRKLVEGKKSYPNYLSPLTQAAEKYSLQPDDIRRGVMDSLKALETEKFDLFYLHGPDRKIPLEETMREVNALVSKFMSREVCKNLRDLRKPRLDQADCVSRDL
jgi:aflatoxin B1 aldehyde reductase